MKTTFAVLLGVTFLAHAALAETVEVPGTANPWLAGMTNGATARRGDGAPGESPVLITAIEGHATYTFCVSGAVNHGSPLPFSGPNGEDLISHYLGAENGIADLAAPFASLIGVFLGPDEPDQTPAPTRLDFSAPADRNYAELAPALKQPFFIGGGLTSSGESRQIVAPVGATRLFLGVMDEYRWADNEGVFVVEVTKAAPARAIQLSKQGAIESEGPSGRAIRCLVARPSRRRVQAASRRLKQHGARTPALHSAHPVRTVKLDAHFQSHPSKHPSLARTDAYGC